MSVNADVEVLFHLKQLVGFFDYFKIINFNLQNKHHGFFVRNVLHALILIFASLE